MPNNGGGGRMSAQDDYRAAVREMEEIISCIELQKDYADIDATARLVVWRRLDDAVRVLIAEGALMWRDRNTGPRVLPGAGSEAIAAELLPKE